MDSTAGPSQLMHEHDPVRQGTNVVSVPQRPNQANHAGIMIAKIETIFESMFEALSSDAKQLSIPYRSRTANKRSAGRQDGVLTFPGRNLQEARKFAQLLRIIQISREALVSGSLVTKRLVCPAVMWLPSI
ncbi:hypothetical protein DL546_004908 [Coniochaeta pulveracea]|uniref:Uncharacterized protein n=1 Tax=Coniochaeta pulveracea TaxID=177199 RepID=A0A420Y208_9PEZI|nr:hypothetical protein DL546_004908 [Coniochaeta pulveracea]